MEKLEVMGINFSMKYFLSEAKQILEHRKVLQTSSKIYAQAFPSFQSYVKR